MQTDFSFDHYVRIKIKAIEMKEFYNEESFFFQREV